MVFALALLLGFSPASPPPGVATIAVLPGDAADPAMGGPSHGHVEARASDLGPAPAREPERACGLGPGAFRAAGRTAVTVRSRARPVATAPSSPLLHSILRC